MLLQSHQGMQLFWNKYEAGIHTIPSDADNSLQHEGLLDLGWMMSVIINDGDTADLAFILETTVCTGKASETFDDHIIRKVQKASYGNSSQRIGYIVDTRYTKVIAADLFCPGRERRRKDVRIYPR